MSLYKILLVDDEEEVRLSIIKKIPWEELGFCVVGDAENGEDALEKIELLEPDLVLTDIKMPYMDGLTLAESIRKENSGVEIVMFSGFDEFEYAKQAIKLNVIEYILKPVNVEELTEILGKIKIKLDKKNAVKKDLEILRENYRKSLPIIKEQFLTDIVHGKLTTEEIEEGMISYELPIAKAKNWVVSSVLIEIPRTTCQPDLRSLHNEKELIPISVQKILDEKMEKQYSYVTFRTSMGICIIFGLKTGKSMSRLVDILTDVCKECKKILEVSVTIGVGEFCDNVNKLRDSYLESRDAVGYRSSVGSDIAICIQDVENIKKEYLQFDEQSESQLISVLKFGTMKEIGALVEKLINKIEESKVHLRQQQAYMISIINALMRFIQRYEVEVSSILGKDRDYFSIIAQLTTLESMQNWLYQACVTISESINRERNNTAKNMIQDAKEYILKNYENPDLSVEMVCDYLHISQTYFSTVFKKETGQNYVNYLTDIRLNKAIELLNETEDKTYIIASKVGYQDPNYFSYVFKKKFGVSPSKYRGNK